MSLFDIQKKIYKAIKVASVTSKAKIYDYVPEDKKMPFVIIGDDSMVPFKTKNHFGWETTSRIFIWGKGRSMALVKGLLSTLNSILSADIDGLEYHDTTEMSAERFDVEYVKGTLEVKYRILED